MIDEPHVMMLSSYVWNWEYNKELKNEQKEKYPNYSNDYWWSSCR